MMQQTILLFVFSLLMVALLVKFFRDFYRAYVANNNRSDERDQLAGLEPYHGHLTAWWITYTRPVQGIPTKAYLKVWANNPNQARLTATGILHERWGSGWAIQSVKEVGDA